MHAEYLMSLTVAQFKNVRKAYLTLVRIGIPYNDALDMVVRAHQNKRS